MAKVNKRWNSQSLMSLLQDASFRHKKAAEWLLTFCE